MFDALKKLRAPAARLEFLERALAPQIADAERALQTRKAAERAEVIASRADELATLDAERAKLEEALTKTAKALDAAIRARRAADQAHTEAYDALRTANYLRDVAAGRYERVLGPLGGDTIDTTARRLRWMACVAADHLGHVLAPAVLKRHQKPTDFRALDWVPAELAEVVARALPAVEALENSPASPAEVEAACEDALTRCYAAAGPTLLRSAP